MSNQTCLTVVLLKNLLRLVLYRLVNMEHGEKLMKMESIFVLYLRIL